MERLEGYYWILLTKPGLPDKWEVSEWKYRHWTGIDDLLKKDWIISYVHEGKINHPNTLVNFFKNSHSDFADAFEQTFKNEPTDNFGRTSEQRNQNPFHESFVSGAGKNKVWSAGASKSPMQNAKERFRITTPDLLENRMIKPHMFEFGDKPGPMTDKLDIAYDDIDVEVDEACIANICKMLGVETREQAIELLNSATK